MLASFNWSNNSYNSLLVKDMKYQVFESRVKDVRAWKSVAVINATYKAVEKIAWTISGLYGIEHAQYDTGAVATN